METILTIATVINAISVIVIGILTLKNSSKMKEMEERNLKLNEAQTELYLQEILVSSRKLFHESILPKLEKNPSFGVKDRVIIINELLKEVLISYEIACAKYLDKKVDKERFKTTYKQEIKDIVYDPIFAKVLNKEGYFFAIKEVMKEWEE